MNKNKKEIAIVLPVYNEQEIIAKNIQNVYDYIEKNKNLPPINKFNWNIYVMNDGSTDNTLDELRKLEIVKKNIVKVTTYNNGAMRRENLYSFVRNIHKDYNKPEEDYVLVMDSDLATDLSVIKTFIEYIDNYDIIIINKYDKLSKVKRSFKRKVLSIIVNWGLRTLFRKQIGDWGGGMKLYHKPVINHLVDHLGYDYSGKRSVMWDTQMLLAAFDHKYKIKQTHCIWTGRKKTSLQFRREVKFIPFILNLWFRRMFLGERYK